MGAPRQRGLGPNDFAALHGAVGLTFLANSYYPAFAWPYLAPWMVPLVGFLIVLIEFAIIHRRHETLRGPWTFAVCVGANLLSSFVGMLLAWQLPDGYVPSTAPEHATWVVGPSYSRWALLSLPLAYGLSVVLEYWVWRVSHRRVCKRSLWRTLLLAHLASYSLLFVILIFG